MKKIIYYLLIKSRVFYTIAVLILVSLSSISVYADDGIEVEGPITELTDSSLVVEGINFFVDEDTEVKNHEGDPIPFSDLMLGDYVEVEGDLLPDSTYLATKIKLEDEHHGHEFETEGFITELGDSSLVVNGYTFFVDENTIIKDHHTIISFSDLEIGDFVEVEAVVRPDSTFLATEIEREDENHGHEFETEGFIDDLGDSSLVVNGYTFFVDENTIIKDHHTIIPFSDLEIGDFVEVEAVVRPDSTFLATEIEREDEHHGHEFETEGFITNLGDSSLVVNGYTFFVDENTVIKDHHTIIPFSDLEIGDFVEVEAVVRPDSTFLATEIEREDEHHGNHIHFTGYIESKDSSSLVVSGITIFVDNLTEIFGPHHTPISFEDLMVGMKVKVKADILPDSTYLATRIKVKENGSNHIQVTAPIDTIIAETVVVAGIPFQTDSNTIILDENHNPITLADLEPGMIVEVHGILLSNGDYYATKIEIEGLWRLISNIGGVVTSLQNGVGIIGEKTFIITATTQIFDEFGSPVSQSYLSENMDIQVRGTNDENNVLLADRIKVKHPEEAILNGMINVLNGNMLNIGGINVNINSSTFITDLANNEINVSAIETGYIVKTTQLQQPNGTYSASRLKVTEDPNIIKVSGNVVTVGPNFIVVSQPSYQVNVLTVVLNSSHQPMDYELLEPGDHVVLWANISNTTSPVAIQILKSDNSVSGTEGNETGTVTEYSLLQNFPNPFNPTTTIRFTVPERAFVSLKVFNILGEEIAVLVNNNLAEGVYNINFDASHLPSGIYLYRIEANNFSQVNKMLLVK